MCRSEFFLKYLPIADGLSDVGKKRIPPAADLVIERQETTRLIRATAQGGVAFCETAELYAPFANDGLQMEAGLNEAGPIGALPAQI